MIESDFKLVIQPAELRGGRWRSDFFAIRAPLEQLTRPNPDFLQYVLDTSQVAFARNRPDRKPVLLDCPRGHRGHLEWLREGLAGGPAGFDVRLRELPHTRFAREHELKGMALCCVDRRLTGGGGDVFTGNFRLAHAGGALGLHPGLQTVIPGHFPAVLKHSLELAAERGARVNRLDYHFGAEGEPGCGMFNLLASRFLAIREKLAGPRDVVDMLREVRDANADVLSRDCALTGTVLFAGGTYVEYDLDDAADRKALAAEKDLVL